MKITILGSGTSTGVPLVCCNCEVCRSDNPKNKRLRSSAHILTNCGLSILIDTGPDLRQQCLRAGITHIDKVLYTHCHADHVFGIDDLRPFNFKNKDTIEVFADPYTAKDLKRNFEYCFVKSRTGSSVPQLALTEIQPDKPFKLGDCLITPLEVLHGNLPVMAFRIDNFGYITDSSYISEKTKEQLYDLDVLIINGLRNRPHDTHFTIAEAVKEIESINPKKAFLTHISHEIEHELGNKTLRESSSMDISLAYDGLILEL